MNAADVVMLPPLTNEDRLRNIVRTYRHAVERQQEMKIPTPLMLLIEAAGLALDDQAATYAETMIRKDQRERLEGTGHPDQDMKLRG